MTPDKLIEQAKRSFVSGLQIQGRNADAKAYFDTAAVAALIAIADILLRIRENLSSRLY